MELYIVRHGETDWNLEGRIQGRCDIPLNGTGREQATALGETLQGICFDAVYTSPLSRAVETAELATGLSREALTLDERLIEMAFGSMDGVHSKDVGEKFSVIFRSPDDYVPDEGAESMADVARRVAEFMEDLKARHPEDQVLVVSHVGAIRAILAHIWGISVNALSGRVVRIENCGCLRAHTVDGKLELAEETSKE